MNRDEELKIIKTLDSIACDANNLWHRVENIKLALIKSMMIPERILKKEGIYIQDKVNTK